jgi:hypothetical protein
MTYHVVPDHDSKKHIDSSDCACHPDVKTRDGDMVIVHHSFESSDLEHVGWVLVEGSFYTFDPRDN